MIIKTDVFCGSRIRTARVFLGIEMDDLSDITKIEEKILNDFERGLKQFGVLPNNK